jgi:hypothetical protein
MAVAAGAVGVTLALIGTSTPLRTPLVVLFLAVAPTAAIARLLPGIDAFARLIVACTATVVVGALAAEVTVAVGVWSPRTGLVVIVVITAAAFAVQLPRFSAPARGPAGAVTSARTAEPDAGETEAVTEPVGEHSQTARAGPADGLG